MKTVLDTILGVTTGSVKVSNFLLIIFSVVLGVGGQIALKYGVGAVSGAGGTSSGILRSLDARSIAGFLAGAATNGYVLLGFVLYLVSALSWLIILSRVELSLAYPLISIGYILVVVLSKFIFDEPVTTFRIVGTLLVCTGVFFLLR